MTSPLRTLTVALVGSSLLLVALPVFPAHATVLAPSGYRITAERRIAKGVTYLAMRTISKKHREDVHVVTASPTAAVLPLVSLSNDQVAEPDPQSRLERTSAACQRHGCLAGVNGDFFCTTRYCPADLDEPEGGIVSDGRMLRSPYSAGWQEQQLSFDADGCPQQPQPLQWSGSLASATETVSLAGVNVDRHSDQAVLYDAAYGPATPPATTGVELVLQLSDPTWLGDLSPTAVNATPVSLLSKQGSYPLDPGSGVVVVSAAGTQAKALRSMWATQPAGVPMQLMLDTAVPVANSVGAKPLLLLNGKSTGQWGDTSQVARTMFAWRPDCTRMLITVDGPPTASTGMSMRKEAALAAALGATTAFGLDGGLSSTLVGAGGAVLNKPSYRGPGDRPTGSSLLLVPSTVPVS
ncbi:MAG TPA: phosphodiester glycosidase family protein [Mycobacteriales bacterium]|nr:phosphodiester glycosidase family protein [Mycobacteriales bacterium]HWC34162.1 phosphodiester glycosidase family protein [Mycobacteriales bacterium]